MCLEILKPGIIVIYFSIAYVTIHGLVMTTSDGGDKLKQTFDNSSQNNIVDIETIQVIFTARNMREEGAQIYDLV